MTTTMNTNTNMDINMNQLREHISEERILEERILEERISEEETYVGADINIQIFRFKFTEQFMIDLNKFAKIHQYDHRKDFKEAWQIWLEENDDIIQEEVVRLNDLGYDGDILDKMFKSARYYFRKKSQIKAMPKTRRQYISVNHGLLYAMDAHIKSIIRGENYQPKNGFVLFCLLNEVLIKDTIVNIINQGINDGELIQLKLKKTYKNRYFMLISK